ncbi:hypothetical protein BGZ79_009910 [Entomortierella chlamydospora]|nr:hypothetical protein BGZ79_009910 [Entomortierella chlamydospora]
MDTFVDWLTDPDNHMRLNNPRPTSGRKQGDLYQEIADHVNNIHDTDWTLETNPPEQSIKLSDDEAEDTNESDDDNEIVDNISEHMVEDLLVNRPTVDEFRSNTGELERKRRRRNDRGTPYQSIDTMSRFSTAAMIESTITGAVAESSLRYIEEARQDLRQRETESYQRMAENERRHQEMLDRRMQEFLEEKARQKQEFLEEKARQKQEFLEEKARQKQEFLEEKAKFKAKQEEFEKIRDRLIIENAAMKRELEIRLAPIPSQV